MRNYIGIDGKSYDSIDELAKANRETKAHPLYVKEMKRRGMMNIAGEISRDEWQRILKDSGEEVKIQQQPSYVDRFESEKASVRTVTPEEIKEGMKKVLRKSVDEAGKDPQFVKDMDDLMEGKAVKRSYKFQISEDHAKLSRKANSRGIPFELNGEQIESLMEKKCYFCGGKSDTVITFGEKFDYKESKGVCGTCGEVHDLLGARMTPWLDSIIENVK